MLPVSLSSECLGWENMAKLGRQGDKGMCLLWIVSGIGC
jgi:hypothetical protein